MPKITTAPVSTSQATRRLKPPTRWFSFRKGPRHARVGAPLPNAFVLFWQSLKIFKPYWKVFAGIVLVYSILTFLLVGGLGEGADLSHIKQALQDAGNINQFITGVTLFAYLLGTSGEAPNDVAGVYQLLLAIITSLAVIWTLRQAYAGNAARIRDGFYKGMHPLVPFLLVLGVVVLQLLPALVGSYVYSMASASGLLSGSLGAIGWGMGVFLLVVASLYMLTSSVMALYIVCLPDVQPMAALRSARQLVRGRRFEIMRKIAFLPLALLIFLAAIMIPLIIVLAPLAPWIFFVASMTSLLVAHGYLYHLYRALLQETQGEQQDEGKDV